MRAIVIPRHGGPEVLRVEERPTPSPGPGEVQIRVRASGINFADLMARQGLYPDAPPPPVVVGYEVSGEISALGPDASGLALGDRVLAFTMFGGYADTVVVPAPAAVRMPDAMSFEVGAAMPVTYLTAHHMLHHVGALKPGDWVAVQAAAGGVGTAAADLVRAAGARMIGIASASKFEFLRERGVEALIGRDEDPYAAIKRITEGRGVDLFLNSEGGPTLMPAYRTLAPAGRLIIFGASALAPGARRNLFHVALSMWGMPRFDPLRMMNSNRGVIGVNINPFAKSRPEIVVREMGALMAMYEAGHLHPHVGATFHAERAGEAHQYIHDRKNVGKVLLTWP